MLAVSLLSTESFASSYDEYAIKPAEQQLSNQQQKVDEPISFLPIPTFITEPAVGPGLGVVGLFFHDNEKKAKKKKKEGSTLPQSISLVGLVGTKNGTKGGAVGHITFWDEDRIRYQGIVGWASINLDFYTFDEKNSSNTKIIFKHFRILIVLIMLVWCVKNTPTALL